jgi:diguanylate cyclase (GGDEF)-like protein
MNISHAPENGENNIDIKEIGSGPIPENIQGILNSLPDEEKQNMLTYLQGNRDHYKSILKDMGKKYDELEEKADANEKLQDDRAVINQQAFGIVDNPTSPQDLQTLYNKAIQENVLLNKDNVSLKQKLVESEKNAMIDVLTGISNKRYFLQEFPKLISLVHRGQHEEKKKNEVHDPEKISMVFFDIDHFKLVNDNYGHEVGDRVLESIGKLLQDKQLFRNSDCVARYGGEEFVVILPNCDLDNATKKAEQIRKAIEDLEFNFRENPITVSLGVSTVDLPRDKNLTEESLGKLQKGLKESSDKLLYEAKASGRNNLKAEQMNLSVYVPELVDIDETIPTSAVDVVDEMPNGA